METYPSASTNPFRVALAGVAGLNAFTFTGVTCPAAFDLYFAITCSLGSFFPIDAHQYPLFFADDAVSIGEHNPGRTGGRAERERSPASIEHVDKAGAGD